MLHFKRNAYVCVLKMISTTSNQVVSLGKLSPTAALTPTGRQLKTKGSIVPPIQEERTRGLQHTEIGYLHRKSFVNSGVTTWPRRPLFEHSPRFFCLGLMVIWRIFKRHDDGINGFGVANNI